MFARRLTQICFMSAALIFVSLGTAQGDEAAARLVASAVRCRTLVGVLHEQKRLAGNDRAQFERRFAQLEKSAEKIRDTSNTEKRQELASELLQALNEKEREKFQVNNVSPTMSTVGDGLAEVK